MSGTDRTRRFEAAVLPHLDAAYNLARWLLRDEQSAQDVVQEAYVRAFTHLESFRGDSSLSTWLSRIAMNEALGRLRRARPSVTPPQTQRLARR